MTQETEVIPAAPPWRWTLGLIMMAICVLLAGISLLHLLGTVIYLGPGGIRLISGEAWATFQESKAATATLLSEQWAGLLSTWLAYICLLTAVFSKGLSRWGDGRTSRIPLLALFEATATVLFSLLAAIFSVASAVQSWDTSMALIGLPLSLVVLPALPASLAWGWFGMRLLIRTMRSLLKDSPETPALRKGGAQ